MEGKRQGDKLDENDLKADFKTYRNKSFVLIEKLCFTWDYRIFDE